jgi:hypothetical protein
MKEESKKQFTEEINWKRVRVHLDKQGIKDLDFLKEKLRLHGESATIREAMRLAVDFIGIREKEIEEIKTRIKELNLREFELYGN